VDKAPDGDTAPQMNAAAPASRTSALLDRLGDTSAGDSVSFDTLLDEFKQRAFGGMLLVVLLPTFIPVPVGIGAVTGPFIALLGLQMLLTLQHPWLPKWLGRRTMKRSSVQRFGRRFRPLLARIERICRPRLQQLIEHRVAHAFTGLQLVLLGFLLSLPIPGTNYPFGFILLLYCIGLIERDGLVLLIGWVLGIAAIVASAVLSQEVVALLAKFWS
jgi:hypothetical protein